MNDDVKDAIGIGALALLMLGIFFFNRRNVAVNPSTDASPSAVPQPLFSNAPNGRMNNFTIPVQQYKPASATTLLANLLTQ